MSDINVDHINERINELEAQLYLAKSHRDQFLAMYELERARNKDLIDRVKQLEERQQRYKTRLFEIINND